MWRNVKTAALNATLQVLVIYKYILMILIWLPNGGLLNILNTKFGFWCFHHSSLNFSYSSFKNGGFHGATACLDMFSNFVFNTQFLPKWVNEL